MSPGVIASNQDSRSGFKGKAGPVAGLPRPVFGPNHTRTGGGPAGVAGAAPPGATRFHEVLPTSPHSNVEDSKRLLRRQLPHQRIRHVVDGDTGRRAPLRLTVVRVAVQNSRHVVPADRFFEPARPEVRINLAGSPSTVP